jgi:hypothetical protein
MRERMLVLTVCSYVIGDTRRMVFWSNHALPHIAEDHRLVSTKTAPTLRRREYDP